MAAQRIFQVSTLNIVTHPHSAAGYIELFEFCRKRKIRGIVNKSRHGYLGSLSKTTGMQNVVHGSVFFYKSIDLDEPWLDIEDEDYATDEDLDVIKQEAQHLKPEFRKMTFIFNANKHHLYFERQNDKGQNFSPLTVSKLFHSMFNDEKVVNKFGEVDVTVLPEEDALSKIFKIHSLRKLTISVRRPNPDDLHKQAQALLKKLEKQNVSRDDRVLTKAKGATSIVPDKDTKLLAEIAKDNGYVIGEGRNHDETPVMESTKEHPKTENVNYTEPQESRLGAFLGFVKRKFER